MHNNTPNMKYYIEPEKPFYKKIPVVPAIILLMLIGAWAFRWDYKTTQTIDDVKIIHKVDRWTGDRWCELYSLGISGAEVACGDIENRRTSATAIWYIAFLSTAGVIVYKARRSD
ncbi:MAG: hypothetical protein WC248_08655 [Candidatus Methanomethylophilaceae archaeon]